MKNELGTMKDVRDLILRGYGLSQMMEKLELTTEDLSKLSKEYPDFGNDLNKRYKTNFNEDVVKDLKEEDKVEKAEEIQDIRAKAKAMGIKNWYNKSEKKLADEIAQLESLE